MVMHRASLIMAEQGAAESPAILELPVELVVAIFGMVEQARL